MFRGIINIFFILAICMGLFGCSDSNPTDPLDQDTPIEFDPPAMLVTHVHERLELVSIDTLDSPFSQWVFTFRVSDDGYQRLLEGATLDFQFFRFFDADQSLQIFDPVEDTWITIMDRPRESMMTFGGGWWEIYNDSDHGVSAASLCSNSVIKVKGKQLVPKVVRIVDTKLGIVGGSLPWDTVQFLGSYDEGFIDVRSLSVPTLRFNQGEIDTLVGNVPWNAELSLGRLWAVNNNSEGENYLKWYNPEDGTSGEEISLPSGLIYHAGLDSIIILKHWRGNQPSGLIIATLGVIHRYSTLALLNGANLESALIDSVFVDEQIQLWGGISQENSLWGVIERVGPPERSKYYRIGILSLDDQEITSFSVPANHLLGVGAAFPTPAFAMSQLCAGAIQWDYSRVSEYTNIGTSPRFYFWPVELNP